MTKMIKLTKALKDGIRLAKIEDIKQGRIYFYKPAGCPVGQIGTDTVNYYHHKKSHEAEAYTDFFRAIIRKGECFVNKRIKTHAEKKDTTLSIF